MKSLSYLLLALGMGLLASGCSTNPVTGKSEVSLISAAQEVAIGEKNYAPYQQQQGGEYTVDPKLSPYIREVGLALARVSDRPDLPYDFVVLNSSVPNAWALPGGKIAINRGLLVLLDDEAQLAAVLGHEIVHAAARHTAQKLTQAQILNAGVAAAGIAIAVSGNENGRYLGLGLAGGAAIWQARYGRGQELESDHFGIDYMVRAGYEPRAAVELQETFVKLSQGRNANFFSNLFASHPPSQLRVDRNREKTQNLAPGKRNRARYQAAIAQIVKDDPAYKKHTEALQALSKNKLAEAKTLIAEAIDFQPKEALFHTTQGQIHMMEKNYQASARSFDRAYRINPNYYLSALGRGLSYKAQGKHQQAKPMLLHSMKHLPTPIAVYNLGEIEEKVGNRDAALRYYRQISNADNELGRAAAARVKALNSQANSPRLSYP